MAEPRTISATGMVVLEVQEGGISTEDSMVKLCLRQPLSPEDEANRRGIFNQKECFGTTFQNKENASTKRKSIEEQAKCEEGNGKSKEDVLRR